MINIFDNIKHLFVTVIAIAVTAVSTVLPIHHKPQQPSYNQNYQVVQEVKKEATTSPELSRPAKVNKNEPTEEKTTKILSPSTSTPTPDININAHKITYCQFPHSGSYPIPEGSTCDEWTDCQVNNRWLPMGKPECDKLQSSLEKIGSDITLPTPQEISTQKYYPCTICYPASGICNTYNYLYKTKEECDNAQTSLNSSENRYSSNQDTYETPILSIDKTYQCGQLAADLARRGFSTLEGVGLGQLAAAGCVSCEDYVNRLIQASRGVGGLSPEGFYCAQIKSYIQSNNCSTPVPSECQQ